MAIRKIELAWVTVSDLEESVKFYQDILGLTVKQNSPEFGWVELQGKEGGCLFGLAKMQDTENEETEVEDLEEDLEEEETELEETEEGCSSCCCSDEEDDECCEMGAGIIVTFTVDDLEKTIAEFKAKGVMFIDEIIEIPNGPRMISFIDPDGNMFQLVEETKMK